LRSVSGLFLSRQLQEQAANDRNRTHRNLFCITEIVQLVFSLKWDVHETGAIVQRHASERVEVNQGVCKQKVAFQGGSEQVAPTNHMGHLPLDSTNNGKLAHHDLGPTTNVRRCMTSLKKPSKFRRVSWRCKVQKCTCVRVLSPSYRKEQRQGGNVIGKSSCWIALALKRSTPNWLGMV